MGEHYVLLVANAVQSTGPVPSGFMLEGSGHLAGSLDAHGYRPIVLDFNTAASVERIAEGGKPRFLDWMTDTIHDYAARTNARMIGFTLYTNGFRDNVEVATRLKKRNPHVTLVAGGPQVSWFEDAIFDYTTVFDCLVSGKGDTSIVQLADHVYKESPLQNVSGALFLRGGDVRKTPKQPVDINTLPVPLYDPEVYPFIDQKAKVSALRTTSGCRYGRCTFCVQPRIDGKYRERDIDSVLEEIETLQTRYGMTNFRLADPNPSPEQLKRFFHGLPKNVRVSSFAYSDQNYDFSEAGRNLVGLFIGVESMDTETLLGLHKTTDPDEYVNQCREMITEAKKQGIATVYANIVPVADDTRERIIADREQVASLEPDFITALPLCPIPGTVLYRQAAREGDASGVHLSANYEHDLMMYELDLLQPSSEWDPPPWQLRVDGSFAENPFAITEQSFVTPLAEHGIGFASDEIVLMANLYENELSTDQGERRRQVAGFQNIMRTALTESDYQTIGTIIETINRNSAR